MPNLFYTNNQFYSQQFCLALVHSLVLKTFLFQAIQFSQTVLFQWIQFSINIVFVHTQLNVKTVLFQVIPFSSIWPTDRVISGATTPAQSGPGSDGSEGVLSL